MNMKNNKTMRIQGLSVSGWFMAGFFLVLLQVSSVWADGTAITELNFSSLSGDEVQIQLGMNGPATTPKIFQTDNPSRIALDFAGVKSELPQKVYAINQGAANAVYVVEASGRTRVVINLSQTVPYETKVIDNNVFVVLKPVNSIRSVKASARGKVVDRRVTNLLPEQTIKNIDFRRGPNGEGRILLGLSAENTVVDVKERGGKVVLNFLNTKLPESLIKSFDVSDFATPVRKIDARQRGAGVSITITPVDGNYDYASYQSEGLLTIDFIPLSQGEKEALLKKKFPYTGKKLTLNFQDIEVRSVLQILADFTELNIIAADSVGGTVTLRLNDVPWDQALDLILKSKGLSKRQTGNVVLVAPTAEITKIEEDELAAKAVVEQLEPLRTEYIQINYAKAEEMQDLLTGRGVARSSSSSRSTSNQTNRGSRSSSSQRSGGNTGSRESAGLLSYRGSSTVDSRTNTLIVKDTAKQLEEIRKLIELLDVPVRQVLIESRIVIASTDFSKKLGVEFGIAYKGGDFKLSGRGVKTKDENNSSALSDLASALTASGPGALAMTLSDGANYLLNLEIQANQLDGNTELLSNPRVMTTDRVTATIKQGTQIPYQTTSQDGTTTELVDAVLELEVTPQITPSGSVIMELNIKKDLPLFNITEADSVPIDTREVNTTVQVEDGQTVVLGGVFESSDSSATNTIPWFSDLPGIGWLFKNSEDISSKKELLIFVTPKIVKNTLSAR